MGQNITVTELLFILWRESENIVKWLMNILKITVDNDDVNPYNNKALTKARRENEAWK